MSIFNINLDNDVDFLIRELGKDIKINNEPARILLQNVDNNDDDKEIITKFPIKQGMYVFYMDKWWMIITATNDKRYNIYNKATIRKCDNILKIIIDEKLYAFPVIFTSSEMAIRESKIWVTRGDYYKALLPITQVSRKITVGTHVLKFNNKYEIWGKNETKENIMEISLWWVLNSHLDDQINEIADRWTEDGGLKKDRLNGNIIPIMPFDTSEESYTDAMVTFVCKDVETEESIADVIIKLTDKDENEMYIIANQSYQIPKGIYTYTIEKEGYETTVGEIDIQRDTIETILLTVKEEEPEVPITYTITAQMPYPDVSDNEIWLDDPPAIYTVHKFVDGVEVDGIFTFEVTDTTVVTITETTDNSASIIANDFYGKKNIKLIATDVDTGEMAIEKEILICGR